MLARTLTCMTCTIGLAVSLSAISGTPAAAQFTFEQYEVVTDSAARQSIVTGFLLDGAFADLAVVHLDENDDRRLRIYAFGAETWVPRLDATLGPDVTFVDVANIGGRDRLLAYEPGRLNWFDPESSTERTLVAVTASFSPPRSDQIHHVDITRDVNHDGRDDLVVPDVDGFWVVIQMSDGAFADPAKIGPAADMSGIYGADGYRYDPWGQSRIHEMDYNHDGRSDLVFWREDHFEVHTQDERGLFAPVAETFTTEVAFDSDDRSSLAAGDMAGRVLHSLTDLNGDGVGDLIVFRLEGRRVSSKQSAYEVHFGTPASDGGTAWTPDLDAAIRSDGSIQLGMDRLDFDRDGQVDMMVTTIGARFVGSTLYRRFRGSMGGEIHLKRFSDSPCTAWARRGTSACTNAGGPMQAYSMDLRERALLDSDAGMKAADVAVKYRVSGSWVRLLKQRRRETGEVAPRVQRHGRRRMLEPHLHTLAALIAEQPDRTLAELKDALGPPASLATIWRAVAALDVTVKKNGPALRTRST